MNNKSLPKWHFREIPKGIKSRNPVQDEFFNSSEALTEISSLVRESIQNSLDAQIKNQKKDPVTVSFTINSLKGSKTHDYFQNLDSHLRSAIQIEESIEHRSECKYLVIEDFNTTGLLGDSRKDQLSDKDDPSENSYHYFVWAEGSSAKAEGKRGRWGIGKIVFPRLSEIKTIFVHSIRDKANSPCGIEEVLIGMSTLRGHSISGKNYQPDGWWSYESNENGIPIPVSSHVVDKFKDDWGVTRSKETGLSIVIPFIPKDLQKEVIRDCVIRDYFIAVMQGLLEIKVTDEYGSILVTSSNLRKECLALGEEERIPNAKSRDEQIGLIDMIEESNFKESYDLVIPIVSKLPNKWSSVNLETEEAQKALLILESGKTLKCSVQVEIPGKVKTSIDNFEILIKKLPEKRTCALFSREGITIPSANPNSVKDHLVLVIANPGPLANLLADAEGPAHEKWSEKTDKFRKNYLSGRGGQLLTYIRRSPMELLFKIRGTGAERDSTAFSKFFPLPGEQSFGKTSETSKRKGQQENPGKPIEINIIGNLQQFVIDESPNGFAIRSMSDNPNLIGRRIYTEVAYKVRSGDPFQKWEVQDFDLAKIKPRLDGCVIRDVSGNRMIIEITGRKFRGIWSNFDPYRDLDVRAFLTELEVLS